MKYTVCLAREVLEYATLEVEANSLDEAEDLAREKAGTNGENLDAEQWDSQGNFNGVYISWSQESRFNKPPTVRYGFSATDFALSNIPQFSNHMEYDGNWTRSRVEKVVGFYARKVKEALQAQYPNHDVEVVYEWGITGALPFRLQSAYEDDTGHAQLDVIEAIAEQVWLDWSTPHPMPAD